MEIKAQAKYIRMSPKKIRQICDVIRGMEASQAETQLQFIKRRAAKPVLKLLRSALANAKHNFGLEKENLYIQKIVADEGPTLYRWQPRAFGRATPRRRRASHISLILSERKLAKAEVRREKLEAPEVVEEAPKEEMEMRGGVPTPRRLEEEEKKEEPFDQRRRGKRRTMQHRDKVGLKRAGGVIKRIFRRKAV